MRSSVLQELAQRASSTVPVEEVAPHRAKARRGGHLWNVDRTLPAGACRGLHERSSATIEQHQVSGRWRQGEGGQAPLGANAKRPFCCWVAGVSGVPGVPFPASSNWYRNGHAQRFRAFHRKRFHLVRGEIGLFPPDLDEHGADRAAAAGAEDGQLTPPTHTRSVRPRARSHSVSATQGHFTP